MMITNTNLPSIKGIKAKSATITISTSQQKEFGWTAVKSASWQPERGGMDMINIFSRKKPARLDPAQPLQVRLNKWCMRNFGYLILITIIISLLTFIGFCFYIMSGSCLESGNYYNHLGDCARITIRGYLL